jgi:hypothetical protein
MSFYLNRGVSPPGHSKSSRQGESVSPWRPDFRESSANGRLQRRSIEIDRFEMAEINDLGYSYFRESTRSARQPRVTFRARP